MGGEERRKRRAGERGGEVRLPHSKFLDPPLPPDRDAHGVRRGPSRGKVAPF